MAHLWSAETAQRLAVKRMNFGHEVGLLDDPLEELGHHFFAIAILADNERIAPFARPTDVDVERRLLGMDDRGVSGQRLAPRVRIWIIGLGRRYARKSIPPTRTSLASRSSSKMRAACFGSPLIRFH